MKTPQRKPHSTMSTEELVQKAYKQAGIKQPTQDQQIKEALKTTKQTITRPNPIVSPPKKDLQK